MASLRVILDDSWEDGELPAVVDVFQNGERCVTYVPERTCELELDEYENVIRCTSCGHEECNPCSNDCMYGNAKFKWKYCPNCGAKVVNDDAD